MTVEVGYHLMTGNIKEVLEVLVAGAEQRPDGAGAFVDVAGLSLPPVVTQERPVQARVCVLNQLDLGGEEHNTFSRYTHSLQYIHSLSYTLNKETKGIYSFTMPLQWLFLSPCTAHNTETQY